jgi:ATP-dependent RNA helicase SUPV3L1/SUV3
MTLEQFANLMEGLGYKAERGEREKVREPKSEVAREVAPEKAETPTEEGAEAEPSPEPAGGETPAPEATEVKAPAEEETPAEDAGPEIEVFYTFAWGGNRQRQTPNQGRPQGKGKPKGKGKPRRDGDGGNKARSFSTRPPKKDKIDPDNPFAQALAGFKDKNS